MPELKTIFGRLGIAAASVLTSLVILEILVRIFFPQQLIRLRPDVFVPQEGYGWRKAPNLDTTINTGERTVRLITDDEGNRTGSSPIRDPDYEVLVLGDSFVEALQVEYEQSMLGLLEPSLAETSGISVYFKNTGVSQWNPGHYLRMAREELTDDADYDAVLVFIYVDNDIVSSDTTSFEPYQPAPVHHFRVPKNFTRSELIDSVFYPTNDVLERTSHLYIFTKARFDILLARVGLTAYYFPTAMYVSEADSDMWETTTELLVGIQELADAQDIPVLYVLLPAVYQVDEAQFAEYQAYFDIDPATTDLDQPNRILTENLEAKDLAVVDLLPVFRQAHDDGIGPLYGQIDRHLTPEGHQLVAEYLQPYLVDMLED